MQARSARKPYNEKLLGWRYGLVEPYIEEHARVLDIGAGTGWVAHRIHERKGCDVQLVDVVDCNETALPLRLYDGTKLPYADKSFDIATLVFVLHHTGDHERILREAARVARRRIIVVEDTPVNIRERWAQWLLDTALSIEHGFATPHTCNSIGRWREVFDTLALRLEREDIDPPFFPFYYTKAVFVLGVA